MTYTNALNSLIIGLDGLQVVRDLQRVEPGKWEGKRAVLRSPRSASPALLSGNCAESGLRSFNRAASHCREFSGRRRESSAVGGRPRIALASRRRT